MFDHLVTKRQTHPREAYGLQGSSPCGELINLIARLEGGKTSFLQSSGLCSIGMVLLVYLKPGDHLLMVDTVYGPTSIFCDNYLKARNIETTYYNPLQSDKIDQHIKENTKLIYAESPGSLTFELQDIPALVQVAQAHNIPVAMDNTWATPLYFPANEKGVDIAIHAGTKFLLGGSDAYMGYCSMIDNDDLIQEFNRFNIMFGEHFTPDMAYNVLRSMRSLSVRLDHHYHAGLKVAKWLEGHKSVLSVLFPALPSHPQHDLWKRDFKGATGVFSFVLDPKYSYEDVCVFFKRLKVFRIALSFGGY